MQSPSKKLPVLPEVTVLNNTVKVFFLKYELGFFNALIFRSNDGFT
jgi:hypothetical protein